MLSQLSPNKQRPGGGRLEAALTRVRRLESASAEPGYSHYCPYCSLACQVRLSSEAIA